MSVTVMTAKTVESTLPGNGFGVPDIYVEQGEKEQDSDRLFVDSDRDYGEETCEDYTYIHTYIHTYQIYIHTHTFTHSDSLVNMYIRPIVRTRTCNYTTIPFGNLEKK